MRDDAPLTSHLQITGCVAALGAVLCSGKHVQGYFVTSLYSFLNEIKILLKRRPKLLLLFLLNVLVSCADIAAQLTNRFLRTAHAPHSVTSILLQCLAYCFISTSGVEY